MPARIVSRRHVQDVLLRAARQTLLAIEVVRRVGEHADAGRQAMIGLQLEAADVRVQPVRDRQRRSDRAAADC